MVLALKQVRDCDGECCRESPRYPNADRSDCIFHDAGGCQIKRGEAEIPKGMSAALPHLTNKQDFELTCVGWPQNSDPKLGETANCCWQWVDDGD